MRPHTSIGNHIALAAVLLIVTLSTAISLSTTPPSSMASPLASKIAGKMILAPLTKGGNLPFRRLCADFGAEVSMGEMVYSRFLLDDSPVEKARLKRAPNEGLYGVQIATNEVDEARRSIALAAAAGADFVDFNCGCPIYEATRRGLGSALLRNPKKLGRLVSGMAESSPIPITVKIRLGCEVNSINAREVVSELRESGAAAITVHGRTAEQRYSKSADWELIKSIVEDGAESGIPIVGNGDILTYYEANRRMEESGVDAVMVGRGALTKPWIFQEFKEKQTWEPSIEDQISVYRRLACYMKEHFGDDDMGRKKAWRFLPWHFDFLSRYMPLPIQEYGARSEEQPLIQSRIYPEREVSPLHTLIAHPNHQIHDLIAASLWESDSDSDAISKLFVLSESDEIEKIQLMANNEEDRLETEELSNIPTNSKRRGGGNKRRGRSNAPQRTPEEIVVIRAERAAKKAALELEGSV